MPLLAFALAFQASATSDFVAVAVLGQVDLSSSSEGLLAVPSGMVVDPAGHVLVADRNHNRVLGWTSPPASNGAPPDFVLGQTSVGGTLPNAGGVAPTPSTLRCPVGVWSDGSRVAVADYGNSRVLIWNSLFAGGVPISGRPADVVVGRPDMVTGPGSTGDLCQPPDDRVPSEVALRNPASVTSDGTRLIVADSWNHRVLIWNQFPLVSGSPADIVLGQSDMTGGTANRGGAPSAATLNVPLAVATDGSRLVVADSLNHRVLIWGRMPAAGDPQGVPADIVLGQRDMASIGANSAPLSDPSATELGRGAPSARTLNMPVGLSVSGQDLAVADHLNNRVLMFRPIPSASFAAAVDEVGHGRFTSATAGVSDRALRNPMGVSLAPDRLYISDLGNNRVVAFPRPITPTSGAVTASPEGNLGIRLSWSTSAGASGYRVFRDGAWLTDIVGGNTTSLLDAKLSPGSYSYSVSVLSDSNRVQGGEIGSASATAAGTLPPLVVTRHDSYSSYLAEGDSVTSMDGAYAFPEDMYFNQIWTYLMPSVRKNAAVSGSACLIGDFVSRVTAGVTSQNPDLVTIAVGVNDMMQGYVGTHGTYSMAAYRDCLTQAIQAIAPSASRTVLVMNLHHMTNWKMNDPYISSGPDVSFSNGSDAKKRAWNKVIRDVAAHSGVPLVDVTAAMDSALARNAAEAGSKDFLIDDRVHPDQDGQDVIADALLGEVLKVLPLPVGPKMPGRPVTPVSRFDGNQARAVSWTWDPSQGTAPSAYELAWSQDVTFRTSVSVERVTGTSHTLNLGPGKWYVRVRAIDGSGNGSPWTNWSRVRIGDALPPPIEGSGPTKPGRPSITFRSAPLIDKTILVSWGPSLDADGIKQYEVCYTRVAALSSLFRRCVIARGSGSSVVIEDPLPMGAWQFQVQASDMLGYVSAWSDPGFWFSPYVL